MQGLLSFDCLKADPIATQPFRILFHVMPQMVPGEYGILKVDGQTSWTTLVHLWHHLVVPKDFLLDTHRMESPMENSAPDAKILMLPSAAEELPYRPIPLHPGLLLRTDTDLTLYEVHSGHDWAQVCQRCMLPDQLYYDTFGKIQPEDEVTPFLEVQTFPCDTIQIANFGALLQLRNQVQVTTWVPEDTDILVLLCDGEPAAFPAFQAIWMHPDTQAWLKSKGRQMNLQQETPNRWRLLLRPLLPSAAIPTPFLRHELLSNCCRQLCIPCLHHKGSNGYWFIAYRNRMVGQTGSDLSGDVTLVLSLLAHFGQVLDKHTPRLYAADTIVHSTVPSQALQPRCSMQQLELALEPSDTQMDPVSQPNVLSIA